MDQLIVTLKKIFKCGAIDTISRWIKYLFIMKNFVDFLPQSCRAASTSKVKTMDVKTDEIISRGCRKFFIYYGKIIREYVSDNKDFNLICRV